MIYVLIIFLVLLVCVPEASAADLAGLQDRFPLALLEQRIDRDRAYPQQVVELSVDLYIKDAPGNVGELDPFSRIAVYQKERIPVLFIPWADDNSAPEDLAPMEPWSTWISSVPTNRIGFSLNRFLVQPGAGGWSTFLPPVERVERKNEHGETAVYWKYTIRRYFMTKKSGTVTLPAAQFSGPILAPVEKAGESEKPGVGVQNVNVNSGSVSLAVLEVPQENRPADDVGIFGVFQWNLDIQPRQAKVGEPLTLTMRFVGDGSIVNAKAPDLAQNAAITGNFKVYPAKEELENNAMRYVYLLRPKKYGKLVLPRLTVSYFNTELEQFQTLKSSPITLEILSAELGSDILLRAAPGGSGGPDITLTESGIFDNFKDVNAVKNRKFKPRTYFLFTVSLAGLYMLLALYVFVSRIQKPLDPKKKRELIIQQARKRFEDVSDLLAKHKFSESCTQAQNILIQFIAAIQGQSPQGMMPRDAIQLIRNWSLDEMQIEELEDLFERLDAIRFGTATSQKAVDAVKKGEDLLEDLVAALPETLLQKPERSAAY